ncbi:MAG: hypothetical protein QOJ75_2272 [Chloroflexota bacterium]|nr:hypothetical protein [Chloroflexota bacterium]
MTANARSNVLPALIFTLIGTLLMTVSPVAARQTNGGVGLSSPASGTVGTLVAVTVSLPPGVAAFDGRVLVAADSAEVIGVAPSGAGSAFRPEAVTDGFAIGAFGLDQSTVDVVVNPLRPGRLEVRVVIDTAADASGTRLELGATDGLATIRISGGNQMLNAPNVNGRFSPSHGASKAKDLFRNGKYDRQDLDLARGAWDHARATGAVCGPNLEGDANGDGCVDIADVQTLNALQGETATTTGLSALATTASAVMAASSASTLSAASVRTFTVTSALDTPDATPGDAICADTLGRCTLRAAMTEADYMQGVDTIAFNLTGAAPVTIQLQSQLPYITARSGGVIIDGYTQPGSSPNTATYGSNAVPGVEVRGTGQAARQVGFYITSPGNTIRGLVIGNVWRAVFLDGADAHDNKIIGDWIGFTRTGDVASSFGQYGVVPNTGSTNNLIGTPDLADRNVIGNFGSGIDEYGPGTNGNITQNNVLCMQPNGLPATCSTGVDHNFGPKNGLIGGTGLNERNVIGPTTLQGIEYSHGWDPSQPPDTVFPLTYQINNNRAIGNWVGFKADGSYDPSYRSGLNFSNSDNAQGINVYDGSNNNIVDGNYIASVYDGIQTMAPSATGNIIRNNIIGKSPLGQTAPLTGWGVVVRWGTTLAVVQGNSIQNAAKGGIGLLNYNNLNQAQSPAYNIRLTQNTVTGTTGPGIDLFGIAGPDPNDPGDADMGANTLLNTPVFTSATTTTIAGTASSGATVEVYRASRPVGQYGLPIQYLGSAVAASSGTWTLPLASNVGDVITALQIATDQNTSELAANVAIGASQPQAPAFTSPNSATFVAGSAGTFAVTTTGSPTPAVSQTGALPTGVTFTPNANGTATLAGTPATGTAGTYPLVLTAANGISPNATQNFTLTVNAAPAITSANAVSFTVGSSGTFTVTTTGHPNATVGESGALPSGVTFANNGNGTATIAGTPATGTDATYPITFTATNGISPDATQSFTLTVNPAAAGAPIAQDSFTRTVSSGWGTAPTGGNWTVNAASAFGVNGSVGTMALTAGATRYGRLASASAGNADMSATVAIDRLPVAGNLFVYLIGRQASVNTEYRMKVRIATDGRVYLQPTRVVAGAETSLGAEVLVAGVTAGPGVTLGVRGQFYGPSPTTIRMRAWDASQAEPGTWATTVTDAQAELQGPGAVALQGYLALAVTNGPVVVSFDNLTVAPLP